MKEKIADLIDFLKYHFSVVFIALCGIGAISDLFLHTGVLTDLFYLCVFCSFGSLCSCLFLAFYIGFAKVEMKRTSGRVIFFDVFFWSLFVFTWFITRTDDFLYINYRLMNLLFG